MSRRTWGVVGGGLAVVVIAVLWLQFGGAVKSWIWTEGQQVIRGNEAALAESAQAKAELASAQSAIRKMSAQITQLRRQADKSLAEAAKWRAEATRLVVQADTEAARRAALPKITSLTDAAARLTALGYHPVIVGATP